MFSVMAAVGLLAAFAGWVLFNRWSEARAIATICAGEEQLDKAWLDSVIGDGPPIHVIGDSYTQGADLPHPRTAWPSAFAAASDHTLLVDGAGSTGFTNPGLCGDKAFPDRIAGIRGPLIVQGGLNDLDAPKDQLAKAVCDVLDRPGNTVIVGPAAAAAFDRSRVARVDRIMRVATDRCGGRYVSTIDWKLRYVLTGVHPDEASQQKFGRLLARAVGG